MASSLRVAGVHFARDALTEDRKFPRAAAAHQLVIDPVSTVTFLLPSFCRYSFCGLHKHSPFGKTQKARLESQAFFAGQIFSSIRQTARFHGPLDTILLKQIISRKQ